MPRSTTTFKPGDPRINRKGRTKGDPNKATKAIRELARSILEQPQALAVLRKQARDGELHPIIQKELMHYAYGKPKTEVEISGGQRPVLFEALVPRPK